MRGAKHSAPAIIGRFHAVTTARENRNKDLNDARSYENQVLSQAGAQASSITNAAAADRARYVQSITAEAKRFSDLLPKYESNPSLFAQVTLVQAMGPILTNVQDKIFLPERADGKPRELRLMLNREPPEPKPARKSVNCMQVTSLLSHHEHEHGPNCGCGHDHEHSVVHLWQAVLGVVFVLNAFIVDWLFEQGHTVASASAFIGAVILGYPIVVTAIKDLRVGLLSINELVAIAVLAAFASGDYKTAGVVAFFMLMGEIIETRTAEGARASIESLIKLTPTKARRIKKDGSEEEVAASELAIGDVIRIRPGDNVAADGVIVSGQGSFNQATITGESLPVDKKPGDEVFAGTQNLTGVLEIKVSRAGEDTTLGRVRELILAAEKTKLPIMKIVDQYMGFYTPLVLVIGALVWAFTHDLNRVIAVFVVSCPCAFILATPTAMVAALSAAARLGILIKNVADIEAAAKINAFVFDKTGTLTTGQLAVSRLAPIGDTKPAELLRVAASAEKYSNHPTAKALAQLAGEAGVPLAEPKDFAETAGRGVKAEVGGAKVLVGRAQWLKDNGVTEDFVKSVDLNETEGWSLIFVARDGQCIGWVGLQDQTRAEAKESLAELKEAGVRRIAMVSGDRQAVATRVARRSAAKRPRANACRRTRWSLCAA